MTKKSFILLLVLSLAFAACGGAEEETVEEPAVVEEAETLDAPATTVAETLDKITFGFIPSAEQADLQDNIKPLMKVLTDGLGIEVEGFVTSDFSGLLVAMGSGQADIGAFNTLGYVNALNVFPTRIEAIAKVVRYGSGSYHANFWTTDPSVCDSPPVIGAFENIDGVPTLILGSETESPDVKALQVGWTFGDDGKIPEVRNIDGVDVTVSPGYACEADLNVLRGEKVIAIGISAEIPNDVVAVRSDLPEDIKSKIYQILSDYMATEEGAAVMDEIYGWTDVVPADNSEFDVVKQAAEELSLIHI